MFPPGVKSVNYVERTSCSLTFGLLASWSSGKLAREISCHLPADPIASWPAAFAA
jgi:hypothetical protein